MQGPIGVAQQHARQIDPIRMAFIQNGLRLLRFRNQANRGSDDAGTFFHCRRARHLIARPKRDLLARVIAAGRHIHEIHAKRLEAARQFHGFFRGPAAIHPIRMRNAHTQHGIGRHGSAHGGGDFKRQARAAFKIAAPTIIALIGQRAQELMQQVTMRGMQFDQPIAGLDGTPGGRDKGFNGRGNIGFRHGARRDEIAESLGRGAKGFPGRLCRAWQPSLLARCLAPGMGQLNGRHGAKRGKGRCQLRVACQMRVRPDADIAGADAAFRHHGGGFHHHHAGTANRA